MLATFESTLPIFLLLVAGNVLRRLPLVDDAAWPGLEKLGFWFLYPALLFVTILNADFSGLQLDAMILALVLSIVAMGALTLALWPVLRAGGLATAPEFSSIFQTSVRWNGFMALAIAERIFPAAGIAVVALVMAAIIIPINVQSVAVVTRFADRSAPWGYVVRSVARNPLILASTAALVLRAAPFDLYGPLNQTFDLVGRAALGMGLLTIGAGLRPSEMLRPRMAVWIPVVLKLAVYPALLIGLAMLCGVTGPELRYLALCAAVPTAMNGFLLARQLGGDAELYATVTTLQTAVSFLSIPAVLTLVAYIGSG
ncbi:MAG: AEC family transporter [Roseitalea porphyridii]|uniref:AEC family transporter n=1 Tax=Roseitalea porphyridii TaxID=1852022 RepID=UPI0032EAA80F